ncbi:glycosyltransferase family 4 protein [Campylobacter peloridis]|uniref:Glycosyltransferase family 4 protein n=1 Tax=Campylobacter peloridis TaxID=488546 RepID=A0ABX6TSY8_9BACT|nr:glycosyltransferase family 4 protein [Campylobacter peloridis]AJC85157.1 glycosyltransferase, family 1 [Campylobacter peloridis LMG 23910]QOQ89183.1 glycosyltransferase family 4 protein [Campylobacter peloridis]
MKILIIDIDITLKGGVSRVVSNLANCLSKMYQVDILSVYRKNELFFDLDEEINVYFLNNKYFHYINKDMYRKYKKNILLYTLFKFIFKYKCFCEMIKNIFQNRKIKKLILKYDIVINNNYFLLNKSTIKNSKSIQIMHGNFIYYSKDLLRKLKYFDTLTVLSNKQIKEWEKYHKNIHVIPNFLHFISDKNTNYEQKNILSIGRFTQNDEKGFLRLIDIWEIIQKNEKYKNWTLTIVGEGENKINIEQKIKNKNLKNIILKPFTKEIEKEYLNASIYAMCSYYEGFPMVLIESASYGLPSIAFDIDTGPSDIIENEKSGFLIEDNNLNEFANKLCILMNDENLRKTYGENAKNIVKSKFSKEVIMKKWENILN